MQRILQLLCQIKRYKIILGMVYHILILNKMGLFYIKYAFSKRR